MTSLLSNSSPVTWLSEPTEPLPELFPSPFDELGPHPVTQPAVRALQEQLLRMPLHEGKMFGVLLAADPTGRIGVLRAFSGMLDGRWTVEGFVPPLFDLSARVAIEVPGEEHVSHLFRLAQEHAASDEWARARATLADGQARTRELRVALQARHRTRREERHDRRERLRADATLGEAQRTALLTAIDNESRRDKAEKRDFEAEALTTQRGAERKVALHQRRADALERWRHRASRRLMKQLHDCYRIRNFAGEERALRGLYAAREPPSGAGDCCAPKLLGAALDLGLRPIALAEFWWGPPPATGGRVQGAFYPACSAKCGPLLPFMLQGLPTASPRTFAVSPRADDGLDVLFEDTSLVVLHKPEGLLSVPAKDARITDSVLARLRRRYPRAEGPLIVHRLDLDTSGLMVVALERGIYGALQKQFLRREVHKRYTALLDGLVSAERGRVELALRVDLEDRPRQIHDPVHGLRAITDWEVLSRESGQTRVAMFPVTGRTHQLRAHAAHPLGLGVPIVGDRLYGHPGPRLMLHAEALRFRHPSTGVELSFERPAPF